MSESNTASACKALSASELSLWLTDRDAWHRKYVEGIVEPETPAMKRGTDIHKLCQGESLTALDEEAYYPSEIRVHELIKKKFDEATVEFRTRKPIYEKKKFAEFEGVPIVGYLDGSCWPETEILEIKTGSTLWTKEEAEGCVQCPFYVMLSFLTTCSMPKFRLLSFSTKNGSMREYVMEPSAGRLVQLGDAIIAAKRDMGPLWELRKSSHK